MNTRTVTSSLASMAAAFAFSASALAAQPPAGSSGAAVAAGDAVHCYGLNSCKGQADCKTAKNECKGLNSCQGQGFKGTTAKACLEKGGVIGDLAVKK
jgi:hypothetical protein